MSMDVANCKHFVKAGDRFRKKMPYSEVCAHLGVGGTHKLCELVSDTSVQLFNDDGTELSFPITSTEAGIYRDHRGRLYYVI